MFKLTRRLEYALIALRHLSDKENHYISAKQISRQYTIPQELLAKILQKMSKLEYIDAVKGPNGGYKLNKKLSAVSLAKFIEDIEGPIGMVECTTTDDCLQLDNCNIRLPINKINDNIRSIFSNISLSEITN